MSWIVKWLLVQLIFRAVAWVIRQVAWLTGPWLGAWLGGPISYVLALTQSPRTYIALILAAIVGDAIIWVRATRARDRR